jgi:hypothetical protein
MAVSYSASHPDLPGDGITPASGPDSARPAFEKAEGSAPQLSPYEASQAQRISDDAPARPQFTDRELGKPRDPAPRLEPNGNVVKAVHAGLYRTRQFAPRPAQQSMKAAPQPKATRPVTIGPKSQQERDLGEAMAAYQRMQKLGNNMRQEFGQKRGRGV